MKRLSRKKVEVGSRKSANLKLKKWKFSNYETLSAFFVYAYNAERVGYIFFCKLFLEKWFLNFPELAPRLEWSSFFFRFFEFAQNDKKTKKRERKAD